jgi:hypothetical protein
MHFAIVSLAQSTDSTQLAGCRHRAANDWPRSVPSAPRKSFGTFFIEALARD